MVQPDSTSPTIEAVFSSIVVRSSTKEAAVFEASQDNDAPIVQYDHTTGFNQQWEVVTSGKYVQIFARHSGKCMTVYENRIEQDAYIIQYENTFGDNQFWKLIDIGNGDFAIQTKNKFLHITIQGNSLDNDARLLLYSWADKNNQKFEFYQANLTTLSETPTKFSEETVLHSINSLPQIY